MAKIKPPKVKGVPNKHLHARTTFLYQAATYLTLRAGSVPHPVESGITTGQAARFPELPVSSRFSLAQELGSHLQTVSRKGQVRLSAQLKRSVCKICNAILIPGQTSTQTIENASKGAKKSWADVLVTTCTLCGGTKRYPVGALQQKRKHERERECHKTVVPINKISDPVTLPSTPGLHTTTDQGPTPS